MTAVRFASTPRVSVIVPHYRDLNGLALCLSKLEQQSYPRDRFEVIVADNASPEGPAAVSEVIAGRAHLVVVQLKGAGPARNGGVGASTGEVLAFIDSDCVAEPFWIEEGVKALESFDFVGGRVRVLVAEPDRVTPVEAFERVFAFDFKTYIERKGFTGAGNLFCPRALFDQVGGFKTGLSEDVEWSRRAQAAGFSLGYAARAIVGHPARRSWSDLVAKWKRINAETWGLSAGASARRLRWFARTLLLPASAVVHTLKVVASPELSSIGQRLGAIGVLFRLRFWRFGDSLRLLFSAT
ncbi:glycosyltransferase [Phenylobacterium sp.]|jgi:glycosyltransferase involved in cell wall biosynthesis|uniref:glycosyltransferase n=1 Tax=Phenylobacterium sp. TaxID=1871053 RepID=UPI002F407F4C